MKAKYLIILSILLLIGLSTYSQVLIKEGKIWSYAESPSEAPYKTNTYHYKIGEQILINDTLYHKILYSNTYNPYTWSWPEGRSFVREQDSVVYRRRSADDNEFIVFDYSKSVGDTLYIYSLLEPFMVDSIIKKNIQGTEFNFWYINSVVYSYGFIHVDRIGSFYGFMTPAMHVGAYITLLCVSEDDQVFYMDPEHNSCHVVKNRIEQLILPECPFVITANSDQQLLVYNETGTAGTLSFYTTIGKKLGVFEITEAHTNMHLPHKGLIMYRFVSTEGYEKVGKLVVQ